MWPEEKANYIRELNDFSLESLEPVSNELRSFLAENKLSGFIHYLEQSRHVLVLGPVCWSDRDFESEGDGE